MRVRSNKGRITKVIIMGERSHFTWEKQSLWFSDNNSERPVDALALILEKGESLTESLTHSFKSRDASASKNIFSPRACNQGPHTGLPIPAWPLEFEKILESLLAIFFCSRDYLSTIEKSLTEGLHFRNDFFVAPQHPSSVIHLQ